MSKLSIQSITEQAHCFLARHLEPGDQVVDATCGNGQDTLWLARQVGEKGEIWAVDVQAEAIRSAKQRYAEAGGDAPVHWLTASHESWESLLPESCRGKLSAFVYNLGYLPGGDKALTTQAPSTVQSVSEALEWLCPGGLITLCVYRGHFQGEEEYLALMKALSQLPKSKLHVAEYRLINHDQQAPVLILIGKKY